MAKPPDSSSLLFGALADSGRIKQSENGSYHMVLEGVDSIDWFTDRPDRVAGEWSPKKLVKKWDGLFGGDEPNAQATFEMGSKRKLVAFEMFKPKLSDSNQTLSFKVRGVGKKNKDLLTGIRNEQLSDTSLFIDGSGPACLPFCERANLKGADLTGADLRGADLYAANLVGANLSGQNLTAAELEGADLTGAKLPKANLTKADMGGVILNDANLQGANLTNAYLQFAYLQSANMEGADLTGADLTYASLKGANLTDATWNDTTCPDGTKNDGTSPCAAKQLTSNLA